MICKTNSVISARGLGILKDEGILFNLSKQHGNPHFPQQNNKKRKRVKSLTSNFLSNSTSCTVVVLCIITT